MRTSESECIESLREAAEIPGKSPTKAEYEDLGLTPASATIQRVMGTWNEAKTAAGLETSPSTGSRVDPEPDGVELPDGVEWEELSADQRWHYRNREWNAERTLRRRARLRSWVNDRKREAGCRRCGVDDPACLDFHHVGRKEMAVTDMITHGYGRDRLEDEIEKCEVLCANCHRKEHYDRPPTPGREPDGSTDRSDARRTTGTEVEPTNDRRPWVYDYKRRSDGCVRCGETDPACLDFHHDGTEKESRVARLVADRRSMDLIRAEVRRCVLLCANCHRRTHFEPPAVTRSSAGRLRQS